MPARRWSLVADIDHGGVFAQIVGSLSCLSTVQQAQIIGFIVNRFCGGMDLFRDGADWIAQNTGKPVFGVLPWFSAFAIEAEDAVVVQKTQAYRPRPGAGPTVWPTRWSTRWTPWWDTKTSAIAASDGPRRASTMQSISCRRVCP
jgi:hypothetical protein